jgi:hypothetical protein
MIQTKLAAIEAEWETQPAPAAFTLFGIPDQEAQTNHFSIQRLIAEDDNGEDSGHTKACSNREGALSKGEITAFKHVPGVLVANGWMQNPIASDFNFETMRMEMVSFSELVLNRRSQPKKNRPTKVDSRKKAIRPSMASGAPKISPSGV